MQNAYSIVPEEFRRLLLWKLLNRKKNNEQKIVKQNFLLAPALIVNQVNSTLLFLFQLRNTIATHQFMLL